MSADTVRLAPCGCRLLVTAAGGWALHAPCAPTRWDDWSHQIDAAESVGLIAPDESAQESR